jgi:uncharacterized repeat protein (TIGR01451 family)
MISAISWGGTVGLTLSVAPGEVSRGGTLTYTSVITNSGSSSMALTYQNSLPTGLDQWNAQYRLNGGGWIAYPATGLIPLGIINSGASISVDIQASVEYSAPGTLTDTARVTDGTTQLASTTITTNVLPSVDAGADKMVGLGEIITFSDASAGDGGDGIASYSWDDDGATGFFDDERAVQPTYTAPGTSELVKITLSVTDQQGGQARDAFWLRVNAFPTVDAGSDRSVNEGGSIVLSEAFASDADGWIASYFWSDHGSGGSFDDPGTLHPTYTAPTTDNCSGEDITLSLTVTDDWDAQASDALTLHVKNVNDLPDVDAGPNQTVHEGDSVVLIGSASDSDGAIVGTLWEQTAGPNVSLSGESTNHAIFIAPEVSSQTELRFRLTVLDNCGGSASDSVLVTVSPIALPVPEGAIAVEKIADRGSAMLGETVHYTYTVTNTGEVTLSDVTATDDKLGDITLSKTTLSPGESAAGTASVVVQESDLPGPLTNTVTVQGMSEAGALVTASDEASVQLSSARSSIEVILEAQDSRGFPISPLDTLPVGETITYVYMITNTGETTLTDLSLVDDRLGEIPLSRTTIAPWEHVNGSFSVTITEADLPGPFENTVVVTAIDPSGKTVTDSDTLVLFDISFDGALTLLKTSGTTEAAVGDTITYTYTITNTGDVMLTDLVLIDDHIGEIPLPTSVLTSGESLTVTAIYTVTEADLPGPLTNAASITGRGPVGGATATETTVSVTLSGIAGGGGATSMDLDGRVIINEIAWSGTKADPADEWIELRNLGSIPVDLSGWTLCWYPKRKVVPDESLWQRIELIGTISPSPIDLSLPHELGAEIVFIKQHEDDLSWRVFDMSWWVAGKDGEEGRGYYTLERRHEETVNNVVADLLYDVQSPRSLDLPDEGAVILLFDAEGNLIDTANAEHPEVGGWLAGNARTKATMERSDPLLGDLDSNWHTNPGVIVYGLDANGHRMAATTGKPNSPDLEDLTLFADAQTVPHQAKEQTDLALGQTNREDPPWVRVAALGPVAAGGGGTVSSSLAFSRYYTDEGYHLAIETATLPAGTYFIWITGEEGETILVPILISQ